ncbi:MAG: hypothetical protein NXI22_17510 [bacterium]|nr:hypothetical protein [bacterium]
MTEPNFPIDEAQKWFAIETNNRAWDLLEANALSTDERLELLHAAHASCFHWCGVGNPVKHLRAIVLLTNAYVRLELSAPANELAAQCITLLQTHGGDCADWDIPFACDAISRAFSINDQTEAAAKWRAQATEASEAVADEQDRKVYQQWLANNPAI